MGSLIETKAEYDGFEVEYEVISDIGTRVKDKHREEINQEIISLEEKIKENEKEIYQINSQIDKFTNYADTLDYVISVCSGVLAGVIDVLWGKDFSLENANQIGTQKIEKKIIKVAQKHGYKGEGLGGAVKHLEDSFPIAADKVTNEFGGGLQHHLRDFSHHPTPVGFFFSMLTQFTRKVYGTDTKGGLRVVPLKSDGLELIGKNLPEKITFGFINWFFHLVSDMAGASGSIAKGSYGTGLPGPLVSLLKEVSAIPIFKQENEKGYKELSVWISKLFNGTLMDQTDTNGNIIKFDLRTEVGFGELLKNQARPVILNECIVRGFYFFRHLYVELKKSQIKSIKELDKVNWKNTVPFKNRTIIRMLTISAGTMTAIDLAFATVESASKSGGVPPVFFANMLMKVNFVGVGRCMIAVGTDVKMGYQRSELRNQRITALNEHLFLLNAKTYYKQEKMWVAAKEAGETIEESYKKIDETTKIFADTYVDIKDSMQEINKHIPKIEEKNKNLLSDMSDILKWG
ncbi:hypothetical protein [Jutongia sp.]|uniref:hypothetical protein n=1 Tax=Jutongia sp. TaxID=2944204 RepID=UPI003080CE82